MANHSQPQTQESTLYVVATPIGNLADITLRALEVLRAVDVIAAEDTRITQRLLGHYGIDKTLTSLHEHNERARAHRIVELLRAGKSVALVSDAGTPAISDPGAHLVAAARAAGYRVVPIPGASAAIAALSASGSAHAPFLFLGFLPNRASARRAALARLEREPYALVCYESPHRILETIDDLCATLGAERSITLAKELTKVFETIHICALGAARAWLEQDPDRQRGEFVLILAGATSAADDAAENVHAVLRPLLAELPLKQAVKLTVAITRAPKNAVYEMALALTGRA